MDNKTVESNKRLAENLRTLADRVEAQDQLVYYSASAAVPDAAAVLPGGGARLSAPSPLESRHRDGRQGFRLQGNPMSTATTELHRTLIRLAKGAITAWEKWLESRASH